MERIYIRHENKFSLNSKTVLRWIKDEPAIRESKKGSKRVKFIRKPQHPEMEAKLYLEYKELRKKGLKVKAWWFKLRARQLLQEEDPNNTFAFSESWFTAFKKRNSISNRRATNTCQREPEDKRSALQRFHREIRRKAKEGDALGPLGKWTLSTVANVDQTPLPFTFTKGSTYADTGDKTVWVRGGASGLDKRQCTAQLTVFADGEPRVKPLLVFRGTGKRISLAERVQYDRRVAVQFQPNAWCDEAVMSCWITLNWKPACTGPMHLIADVHRAQKTEAILHKLKSDCNTESHSFQQVAPV